MKGRYALLALAAVLALATIGTALAHDGASSSDGSIDNAKITHHHHQHGGDHGHLPATSDNVQLVSKLELKNVEPDKIADVGVWKGYAYLAAWGGASCKYNGVHVVDIRNPAAPKEAAFIQAKEGSAPGEGIQALRIDTSSFAGDVLVTNNEKCKDKTGFGGLNVYNVSNPEHPTALAEGFGDETVSGQGKKAANEIHSIFAWDAGAKAYAVIVDNEEGPDVDIVDISNPKKPAVIAEYDLDELFEIEQATPTNLVEIFHHDVVVKEIAGRQIMLVSYWDGGYVKLDVTDPKNATYLADSDMKNPDPELLEQSGGTMSEAPEGNAHEAEFTKNSDYIVAADEDFNPTGVDGTTNDGGTFTANPGDSTPEIPIGEELTGDTRYVGRACPGDPAVPAGDGTQIAVVSRGLCTFTEKVAAIEAATGYRAAIVVNREGADGGCGVFGMSVDGNIPALSVERKVGFDLFDAPGFNPATCPSGTGDVIPGVAIGAVGDNVTLRSFFDGWGYVHLFRNNNGKLVELDTFAIPEAMDPDFAEDFGDLSVHEAATSPTRNDLVYFSYYSGGFRVLKIQNDELVEVGSFIDQGGNDFWGVQVFPHAGQEYVAASDMDFGLYVFRYTGSD
jgi:hypothetical protein